MWLAIFACTTAHADEVSVTLQSGEVIRGTLISEANGVVAIKHAILGDLKINRAMITNIAPITNAQVTTTASASTAAAPRNKHILSGFTNPYIDTDLTPVSTAPNDSDALASRSIPHAGSSRFFYNDSTGHWITEVCCARNPRMLNPPSSQ